MSDFQVILSLFMVGILTLALGTMVRGNAWSRFYHIFTLVMVFTILMVVAVSVP